MKNLKHWLLALMSVFMLLGVATACTDAGTENDDTNTEETETDDTNTEEGTEEEGQ